MRVLARVISIHSYLIAQLGTGNQLTFNTLHSLYSFNRRRKLDAVRTSISLETVKLIIARARSRATTLLLSKQFFYCAYKNNRVAPSVAVLSTCLLI